MLVKTAEVKIVSKPAFTVAGMRYHGDNQNQEIAKMWDVFGPKMGLLPDRVDATTCYGVCDNFDEGTKQFDYIAACEVKPGADLPEGMVTHEIPSQTYAVFETTLPEIHDALDYIYATWLPASEHDRGVGPEFELYDESFNPNDPGSKMYLFVPIDKACRRSRTQRIL